MKKGPLLFPQLQFLVLLIQKTVFFTELTFLLLSLKWKWVIVVTWQKHEISHHLLMKAHRYLPLCLSRGPFLVWCGAVWCRGPERHPLRARLPLLWTWLLCTLGCQWWWGLAQTVSRTAGGGVVERWWVTVPAWFHRCLSKPAPTFLSTLIAGFSVNVD